MGSIKGKATPYDLDTYRRVNWLLYQFDRYDKYWRSDINRYVENARMFWGINYGQWPSEVVEFLRGQGRVPPTFNFTMDKIETFVGSIMGNTFDIKFSPISGQYDSLSLKLQDMYISDKINLDWDICEMETLLDCAVAVGYKRMYVSDKMHWLGNIAWERPNPRHIRLDPSFKSSDPYRLRSYYREELMTPEEIFINYDTHSERLKELRKREMIEGIDHGENMGPAYKTMEAKWGGLHRVIEFHWIDSKERYWEFDTKNNIPFPDAGYKLGSDEDRSFKIQYIKNTGLRPEDIVYQKQKTTTKYIQACAPSINAELLLIDGPDRIQVGNCNLLPLGWKYEGQYAGIVDRLKDLQRSYNKGEMLIEDQQMRSARGGKIWDKALAGGDSSLEQQIEEAWNDPAANVWAATGSTANLGQHGGVIPLNSNPVSNDIFNQQQRREKNFDRFSKVPAAQESRSEYAGEPASIFKDKNAVAILGQRMYQMIVQADKKHEAEMYARQAKITYSGVPREFSSIKSKKSVTINKNSYNENGLPVVLDDIRMLPEQKVNLVPAKDSISLRDQVRQDMGTLLTPLAGDPQNRLLVIGLTGAIIKTTPMPDEEREEFDKTIQLLKKDAALSVALQIKQKMMQLNPIAPEAPPDQGAPQQSSPTKASELESKIGTTQQAGGQNA